MASGLWPKRRALSSAARTPAWISAVLAPLSLIQRVTSVSPFRCLPGIRSARHGRPCVPRRVSECLRCQGSWPFSAISRSPSFRMRRTSALISA